MLMLIREFICRYKFFGISVFLLVVHFNLNAQETYKVGDTIEVDVAQAGSAEFAKWKKAGITKVEMWNGQVSGYVIKTDDGRELIITARHMRTIGVEQKGPGVFTKDQKEKVSQSTSKAENTNFKVGDTIEIDVNQAGSPEFSNWKEGTITNIEIWNGQISGISLRTSDGREFLVSRKFIRPLPKRVTPQADPEQDEKKPAEDEKQNAGNEMGEESLDAIFQFGKANRWTSPVIEETYNQYVGALRQEDQSRLYQIIKNANTRSARFFALKSYLAGDTPELLQKFISEMNQYPEDVQQERCLVITPKSVIQQWQQTCSVTTVQAILGDLSPRYTWDVKNVDNYDKVAPDPSSNPMAQQQKIFMESYGGVVSPRGDVSGKEIGILYPLNELVGPLLRARFYAQEANADLTSILGFVRNQLDKGVQVPLLINFDGSTGAHFISVMRYKPGPENEYLIYDPWVGVCNYVSESNLLAGSLSPINTTHRFKLSHYFPTTTLSSHEIQELINRRNQKGF